MPSLSLNGLSVDFPFIAYDCQKDYMRKVIECLQRKVNGVLESPTGTGKTLCLLCSVLAWRENFKDTIAASKFAERLREEELFPNTALSSWGTGATDGVTPIYYTDVPKIIYASRTHSQLTQVIRELKKTSYRPKVCVLGSREQLCINPEVLHQESNHVKVHMCRGKVSTRTCSFYNNLDEKSTDRDLTNSILDVEDLVKFGKKQRVCPYYLSRSLKHQADLIFMPYNYLLDPKSRRAHNIDLNGAVVIFDEAHNVEKTCEESTSFDLTPYDVASAITAVDSLLMEQAKDASAGDSLKVTDIGVECLSNGLKTDIHTLAKIKQIFLDLEEAIDSYDISGDKGITKPGIFIYELLKRAHLTYSSKTAVNEALEQILGYLTSKPGIFLNTSGLQKLCDIIQLVFSGEPTEKDCQQQMEFNTAHFKVHIHRDDRHHKKKRNTDLWASSMSTSKNHGNVLSYWCFSPGFSMQDLKNQGVRCIILTSGTLSPLSSFTSEMRINFDVRLENSHVIERDQIFISVIDRGPDGVQLSSAFDRRFLPENMASLGNTIANLSRVVPHGLLVFFPSFPLMEKTLDFWRTNGHADRIESIKPMFVEPKGKGLFSEVIDSYYSKVSDPASKGGTFVAVCRGKASEGLDFTDMFGRGVIITGLPFPPKMDPRVLLKMQFLDEMNLKKDPGVQYLTGQQWYREQAYRAVNQAIGRVIRHKEDYGAIFLCDHRFNSPDARTHLSSWVRPYLRTNYNFGNIVREVTQFFRVAQKMRPLVSEAPAPDSCGSMGSPDTRSSSYIRSSASCSVSFTQKAKVLDPHLPSLKRRKLDGNPESDGVARICIDYKSEKEGSQTKPGNLLDALEQGGHHQVDDFLIEDRVSGLATQSLQYNKRMDDDLRVGKRKIKLVQEQKNTSKDVSEVRASRAKRFLAELKNSLSQVNFERIVQALHTYKRTDDLNFLLHETAVLTEDTNTHSLLRGFYQFVRPHHKKCFDEKCQELTGSGCGYKPAHSLSKDEKKTIILNGEASEPQASVTVLSSSNVKATCSHLNTHQLNQGGQHLSNEGLTRTQTGSAPKDQVYAGFLADVKELIGLEKFKLFFQAIQSFKCTDNFENLMTTVLSIFTEEENDFKLLLRFGSFIPSHYKKQYKELLDSLSGKTAEVHASFQDEQGPVSPRNPTREMKPRQPSSHDQ